MIDPPRATVPDAVLKCRTAGIRVCHLGKDQVGQEQTMGVFGDEEPCDI